MFGHTRRDSMTGVFLDLSIPTLHTVVHNPSVLFANQSLSSCNNGFSLYVCTGCFLLNLILCIFYTHCVAMELCLK